MISPKEAIVEHHRSIMREQYPYSYCIRRFWTGERRGEYPEVERWCLENLEWDYSINPRAGDYKVKDISERVYQMAVYDHTIYFENETDMALFRMRWL